MPFTPIHMGPGASFKAIGGRHFSLMMFGFSQVLIDLEPLVRILRGDTILHGFSHTYIGASLVALVAVLVGKPGFNVFVALWNRHFASDWPYQFSIITWAVATVSVLIGVYSHVLFDSVMHWDMHPLAPVLQGNVLYQLVSIGMLHSVCLSLGFFGGLVIALKRFGINR